MSGLSGLPLISRIDWTKTPQNPRDAAPLNFIFITVFVFGISHALPEPRSLRYGLIHFFTALGQCSAPYYC